MVIRRLISRGVIIPDTQREPEPEPDRSATTSTRYRWESTNTSHSHTHFLSTQSRLRWPPSRLHTHPSTILSLPRLPCPALPCPACFACLPAYDLPTYITSSSLALFYFLLSLFSLTPPFFFRNCLERSFDHCLASLFHHQPYLPTTRIDWIPRTTKNRSDASAD